MRLENSYICFSASSIIYGLVISSILLVFLVLMFRSQKAIGVFGIKTLFA